MVAATGIAVACAVGAYLYLTNKRACDERLNSWIEQLSETQADSDSEITMKSVPRETTESESKEIKVAVPTKGDQIRQNSRSMNENTESKDSETTDTDNEKSVHLKKELVEEIIQKLRSTENECSQKYTSMPTAPQAQSQLVAYQYPYAQSAPVAYRNAPIVYQQSNLPPGVMIQPSSPIVWTAVQMTPQPNIAPRKHSRTNNTEEERKRKKRSKKKKSSKRKHHHRTKKEGKNTESTDEEEREERRRRRKEKRAKRKSKHSKKDESKEGQESKPIVTTPKTDSAPDTPATPQTT